MLKRLRILMPVLATLALVASLIGMAAPVAAHVDPADSNANVLNLLITRPLLHYHVGDTIEYSVIVSVPLASGGINPANQENVDVTFTDPAGNVVNFPTIPLMTRGDSVTYTSADDAVLAYVIDAADIVGGQVQANATAISEIAHTNVSDSDHAEALNNISTEVFQPSTMVSISSSAAEVVAGGTVDLIVTETNDSVPAEDLFNASVAVNDGVADIATLIAPPDSGDAVDPGVLNAGEIWSWTISGVVVNNATTYTATGSAFDADGTEITFPDDPEEQDEVSVDVLNPTTITTITSSADSVVSGGTVDLTVTEENDGDVDLTSPQVVVTQEGAIIATLVAPPDSGDAVDPGVLNVGETWSWTITSDPITVDPTAFVATGSGTDPLGGVVTFPGDEDEQDSVSIAILVPSTITTITSSDSTVASGGTVDLTVTEENDGEVDLTSPQVVVTQEGAIIATLVAPPDSGDAVDPGVLNVGETWSWTITSDPITVTPTTFVATGSGTDPAGNVITFPDDPDEQDDVQVEIVGDEGCTPGFWKTNATNWDAVAWVGYSPDDLFDVVFGVDVTLRGNGKVTYDDPTLLQALDANGGGINALARHATAALLNISNPNINYAGGMSEAELIAMVQAAIADGDEAIQELAEQLAGYNEAGCSINQQGEPIIPEES